MSVPEAGQVWCVVVPHHAQGARHARHRLAASLDGRTPPESLADIVAVAAELLGNAVRHATPLPGDVMRVAWRAYPAGTVEIRVTDGGSTTTPTERQVGAESPDGRGLAIVGALALSWGIERDGLGQCVWARLPMPATRPVGAALAGTGV
jgi:anti-sigma regulatory factor (Ser/Thr protein kinase)